MHDEVSLKGGRGNTLLYTQLVVEEMTECERVKIAGENVNNIRYIDNVLVAADSEKKLQGLGDRLLQECMRMELMIDKEKKTEVMGVTISRERLPVTISIDGTALKQVDSFRYLRTWKA